MNAWTETEDALLRGYIADGVSPCAAAQRLSRPESSVYRRIESLGLGAKADARPQRKARPCLCCSKQFLSEGPHNRLCGRCRGKEKTIFDF